MTHSAVEAPAAHEKALQKLVTAFISTGLAFLLLPGTFLGVRNLIAISNHRAAHSLSPAWIQAHGQAQMFGCWFVFGLWSGASYDPARGMVEEGESELVGTMK